MGTYINFIEITPNPKTKVWEVVTKEEDNFLGIIKWFGRWRKYTFMPSSNSVYEEVCLREIADWIECRTKEHRDAKRT